MKSKGGFMVNVAECCFRSCLCLCSRRSLAFCKPTLNGPLWILVHLSTGLYSYSSGPGVVCRTKETACWAASGFIQWVLGMDVELRAALWSAIADVGEERWLGLIRKGGVYALLNPPSSSFCFHTSSCASVGETNAAEAMGTGKMGIRSSFILCCI